MDSFRWETTDQAQPALFDAVEREAGKGEYRGLEFLLVRARSIINEVPAESRLPFRYTINAYRGCSHACVYCFARPTHEYLGLNGAEDFERRIVVKINAVELLRAETAPRRWAGDHIAMGTNTDPYQRCEGKFRLTRGIVEVLAERRIPFSILTKNTLILRDLDILAEAAAKSESGTSFSIGSMDEEVWKRTEPGTPHPTKRIEAVRKLNNAGVPCGVLVAPILPGISDSRRQLERVIKAAVDAGATAIVPITLHLRPGVRELFMPWLELNRPDLVRRYASIYRTSYAPDRLQDHIGSKVNSLVREAGGPEWSNHRRIRVSPASAAQSQQLALGL